MNGVVEFHWKKLSRRNGRLKQAVENHLCSSLPDGLSLDGGVGQEQGEDMAHVEAGCSSEAVTHQVGDQEGISRTAEVKETESL